MSSYIELDGQRWPVEVKDLYFYHCAPSPHDLPGDFSTECNIELNHEGHTLYLSGIVDRSPMMAANLKDARFRCEPEDLDIILEILTQEKPLKLTTPDEEDELDLKITPLEAGEILIEGAGSCYAEHLKKGGKEHRRQFDIRLRATPSRFFPGQPDT